MAQSNDSLTYAEEQDWFEQQTARGRFYTGANFGLGLGLRNENVTLDNSTVLVDFYVSPRAGVFMADQWLVGGGVGFFTTVATFDADNEYQLSLLGPSVFTRYYLTNGFFAEVTYGWGKGEESFVSNNNVVDERFNGNMLTGGLGVGNFWFEKFSLELLIQYGVFNNSYKDFSGDFSFSGLKISAGISFCPNPKKK